MRSKKLEIKVCLVIQLNLFFEKKKNHFLSYFINFQIAFSKYFLSYYIILLRRSVACSCSAVSKWDIVFKSGPSKICGRQPSKNLKGYGMLKQILRPYFFNTLSQILLYKSVINGFGQSSFP